MRGKTSDIFLKMEELLSQLPEDKIQEVWSEWQHILKNENGSQLQWIFENVVQKALQGKIA